MIAPIHVLLVEDNPGDADLTRDTLETGKVLVEIAVVVDGEAALDYLLGRGRYAEAAAPDLVILDLNLPRLSGVEVLAQIRKHDQLRDIPVVMLTSSDSERDVARCYEAGARSYVTKPVDLAGFLSIVQSIDSFWFTVVKRP